MEVPILSLILIPEQQLYLMELFNYLIKYPGKPEFWITLTREDLGKLPIGYAILSSIRIKNEQQ